MTFCKNADMQALFLGAERPESPLRSTVAAAGHSRHK
jgi:hypothetical protein